MPREIITFLFFFLFFNFLSFGRRTFSEPFFFSTRRVAKDPCHVGLVPASVKDLVSH